MRQQLSVGLVLSVAIIAPMSACSGDVTSPDAAAQTEPGAFFVVARDDSAVPIKSPVTRDGESCTFEDWGGYLTLLQGGTYYAVLDFSGVSCPSHGSGTSYPDWGTYTRSGDGIEFSSRRDGGTFHGSLSGQGAGASLEVTWDGTRFQLARDTDPVHAAGRVMALEPLPTGGDWAAGSGSGVFFLDVSNPSALPVFPTGPEALPTAVVDGYPTFSSGQHVYGQLKTGPTSDGTMLGGWTMDGSYTQSGSSLEIAYSIDPTLHAVARLDAKGVGDAGSLDLTTAYYWWVGSGPTAVNDSLPVHVRFLRERDATAVVARLWLVEHRDMQ